MDTPSTRSDQDESSNSNELSKDESITPFSKQSSSSKDPTPTQSPEPPNHSEIRISNVTSMTSVIRLASPKKQSIPEPNIRPLVKTPFSKQPKKIVVKFKKPFVPVVEEDANLQPPEKSSHSLHDTVPKTVESDSTDQVLTSKADETVDQLTHPFSPLRQTYTPPPPIHSLLSKNRDDDTSAAGCASSIVELCAKESTAKAKVEVIEESDDGDSHENPINNIETNDFVDVDSHKCDKEIFTIEFKDDLTDANGSNVKIDVVQIKIDHDAVHQVQTKPMYREESILPDCKDAISLPEPSSNVDLSSSLSSSSSSSSSQPTTSSQTQNNFNEAGPSRIDYGLSSFEDFYSSVRLSPISFTPDNYAWNQRFSPQYVPFENEKNSYMDLDMYKNTNSYEERAPSTDSLNIRTDEKMPAKGEISEQESNGDVEGSSWSHQVNQKRLFGKDVLIEIKNFMLPQMYPLQDTFPRYPSSYDTTVARESWSLSNDQNLPNSLDSPVVLPKL